jgi:creatinine amidohydrolase
LLPPGTFEVWDGLGHAGEGESSIAYHLFPQWCEPELACCVVPDHLPAHVEIKWDFSELTHMAATGDSTKSTPEKGAQMEKALVDCVVGAIRELDARDWDYATTGAGL